jgi:23S rRNA (adenine2503-C2)-methyltransferase
MQDIKELNLRELEAVLHEWGLPRFHAQQIFTWVYKKGIATFSQMSDLPWDLRKRLEENFNILSSRIIKTVVSKDMTTKLLFELKDKEFIEAVSIPAKTRVTACVSSQAGCKFSCGFCASGLFGFKRNLSCAEIIEQILLLKNYSPSKKLTHIVFMGTGEPLDNYDAVLKAIRIINSEYSFNIAARRITISTCGLIPGIKRLSRENLQIELSISLHAADDKIRTSLIPVNKKYPLKELILACKEYINKTDRQVTFEYVLIKGINSDLQNAQKLGKMLRGLKLCKVNLIPSNRIEELKVEPPEKAQIILFRGYLLREGIPVTVRRARGEDIEAACGQLRLRYVQK